MANDEHMAEEEREGLADFRRNAPIGLREALGLQYREFTNQHPTTRGLKIVDRDPEDYVAQQQGTTPEACRLFTRYRQPQGPVATC